MPRRGGPAPVLKRCLPRNGMNWGLEPMILARSCRDAKVMRALKALGVPGRPRHVQTFFRTMFDQATAFVTRRQLPAGMTLGEFCLVFGRTNALARKLGNVVVFSDLFEALIFGRARYIQRGEETGWSQKSPVLPPCELAVAVIV